MSSSSSHFSINAPVAFRLRVGGVLLGLSVLSFWAYKGAHAGWTQNRREIRELDPITELEKITYEDHYLPGLDHLALGLAVPFLMFAVSFVPVISRSSK